MVILHLQRYSLGWDMDAFISCLGLFGTAETQGGAFPLVWREKQQWQGICEDMLNGGFVWN